MQVIVLAVLFAVIGVVLGLLSPVTIPITYARYTAVALLAALDSIFGAFKAYIAGTFEPRVFFSGLITNMTLAGGLTYFGDKLGVDLSIAAIVAFGVRIFNNLGGDSPPLPVVANRNLTTDLIQSPSQNGRSAADR